MHFYKKEKENIWVFKEEKFFLHSLKYLSTFRKGHQGDDT